MGFRSVRTTKRGLGSGFIFSFLVALSLLFSCTKLSQLDNRNPASQNTDSNLETQLKKHEKADNLSTSDETANEAQKEKPESNNNK
jgi:hypothetical protein